MSAKRRLITVAAAVGLAALAVAAVMNPAVQTWEARRLIAARGSRVSLGSIGVGLGRTTISGLRIETDDGVFDIPAAEAEIGIASSGFGRGYHFRSLVAKGWTLDLTGGATDRSTPAASGPWQERAVGGILAAFNVPGDLSLDGVDLEGAVLFPDETGRPAGRVKVVVTGGGLAAGRDGRFLCTAAATVDDPAAPVSSVAVEATLTAKMEAGGALTRAELKADATARGRDFPKGIGLAFVASAARSGGRQSYSFSLVRGLERFAAIDAESPVGSMNFEGSWRLNLKDTDLAPFMLGRSLPAFFAAGDGSFDADASTGDVHAVGKLEVSADRLGVLARGLAPLGHVDLSADFDIALLGPSIRVARLETSIMGAQPVASMRALQPFEFNPLSGELKVAAPTEDLVGISVTGLPLAWMRAAIPGYALVGDNARGEFVMRAEDGRLALRTKAPLVANGVNLSRSGRALASGLEVSAFVLADYAPQGWQIQLAPFAVRSGGIKILSLEARFGRLSGTGGVVKAAGSWSASVPGLLSMPVAEGLPGLSAGDASGSFEASLGATREVRVKLAVKDLAAPAGSDVVLPAIASELRADFGGDGRITFSVPLRLDYGTRTADVAVTGTVTAEPKGPFFDMTLAGTRLTREDLGALSVLLGRDGGPASPGAGAPARAPAPFWPALRGRVALRIESLPLDRVELRDVRGMVHIEPLSIALEGGSAGLGDASTIHAEGRLAFGAGDRQPYSFSAEVGADNVDSAPLFRAADPDNPPVVEGRFDVTSHVTGAGASPRDLLDRVQGSFTFSSKDGKFRALRTDITDAVRQTPSRLAGALDTVTALFGKKTENLAASLIDAANGLSEIHYDQMSVTAERGPGLDITLTQINLIAPEVRLTGTGTVSYVDGVQVRDQPLSAELDLGVQGRLGKFLDLVGMLKDGQDDLGYMHLYQTVRLGGTLRNVDPGQWREMLVQAPLRKGSGLIDKLLGR
jgi:hypothetical protein